MSTRVYFDEKARIFCTFDTANMTARERANWAKLQAVLDSEFDRGFARGLEVGRLEQAASEEKRLDFPQPVL